LIRLGAELPPRKAAALVADIHGLKAREVYERLLELKD
jgi:16S rRNA C1402 (ribose-2'-O) methylase RsmI